MTTIKSTTEKKERDDTIHKCDVLFLTQLTIGGDNYRYNKKHIEKKLISLGLTNDKLPKYSRYRNSISFVLTHKVNDYSIKGFLNDNSSYSGGKSKFVKVGVFRNLNKDIKDCIFGDEEYHSSYMKNARLREDTEKFSEIRNTLDTLNNLSTTFHSRPSATESFDYIMSQTDEIKQQVFLIDNENENGGAEYMRKVLNSGYSTCDYDYDIVSIYQSSDRLHMNFEQNIERFTQYITPEKFEEQFKLKEYLDNLEKEYSKDKDVSVKLELNKTFDIKLTRTLDDTDESLMCRAKDILYDNLINTLKTSDDIIVTPNKECEVA